MARRGWPAMYAGILEEFGYDRKRDERAAALLNSILESSSGYENILNDLHSMIHGRTVLVIGAGRSLGYSLGAIKRHRDLCIIAADGAAAFLHGRGISPDVAVSDLDGDPASLERMAGDGTIMIVHAHGDNIGKLGMAARFSRMLGTTQGREFGCLRNFGGFTDGDRCVFLADHFGAKNIVLLGMDLDSRPGRHSRTKIRDIPIKTKKLARAKILLEWLAQRSKAGLYTTSGGIAGFKNIGYPDIAGIRQS